MDYSATHQHDRTPKGDQDDSSFVVHHLLYSKASALA